MVPLLGRGAPQLVHRPRDEARRTSGSGRTSEDELSHYSAGTYDVDYRFPWGWDELEGIANRTDFDLKAHIEHSAARTSPTSIRRPTSASCRT